MSYLILAGVSLVVIAILWKVSGGLDALLDE